MSLLTIVIVTFNRCEILESVLKANLSIARDFDVNIKVCNNGSTDSTIEVLEALSNYHNNLSYENFSENLGYDDNVIRAMNSVDSEFAWLMGDSAYISSNIFSSIFDILDSSDENSPALIGLNNYNRVVETESKKYDNFNEFFSTFGWHLTLIDSVIWPVKQVKTLNLSKYSGSNLVQVGALFDLINSNCEAFWIDESGVSHTDKRKISFWTLSPFNVWCDNFLLIANVNKSNVNSDLIYSVIKNHNENSGIFRISKLIEYKNAKNLSVTTLYNHRQTITKTLNIKILVSAFTVAFIPQAILDGMLSVIRYFRRH
ncbi:glycosyltransferase [Vibrio lentus]|uniref:Glycosyltransferase 2-like domain-containing protein n=1 Tax=Vibrio lentus TaxID=136468 RepID=A0AB36XKE3_9VIBR|nr:glycosyltransferase [Vibrio lentus]MCC4837790.1 glycosyltransferase [Vibrio lentus]PMI15669.1 hypothetical protein BCU51_17050 [Vibrio lentus]PMK31418.1 hypothetical protein BCU02_02055 [Vibrio lentus]PMK46310.1 hypothetical protein BCT99_20215 [Vibrio lentus]PML34062.1 hypothetical protein BCT79_10740 [Vibrio lentus]